MLFMLAVVVLSGFAILAAGSTTSSLQVKDFGSAFVAAAAMTAAGWLLSMPIQMVQTGLMEWLTGSAGAPAEFTGWWLISWSWLVFAAFTFAENFILFFIVGPLMPGISIRGLPGPLVAIILMTLIDLSVPLLWVNAAGAVVA